MTERQPIEHYGQFNGVELCWFEWGERDAGRQTLFLAHATGFHARCWDQVLNQLEGHAIAVDLRGHGRSASQGPYDWTTFAEDLAVFAQEIVGPGALAIGHSMGGHAITEVALNLPGFFDQLLLLDPVILSPTIYGEGKHEHSKFLNESGEHPVSRRRNYFESVDQMIENFQTKGSYGVWLPAVLRDYCQWGSVPAEDGLGVSLACRPQTEAAIYMGSAQSRLLDRLDELTLPITVVRAKQRIGERETLDFSASPTWPELANRLPQGTDRYHPELTHFIPMQAPEMVAQLIRDLNR